jgi:hypothetical protein
VQATVLIKLKIQTVGSMMRQNIRVQPERLRPGLPLIFGADIIYTELFPSIHIKNVKYTLGINL